MAKPRPISLRLYGLVATAAWTLAPAFLARRARRGKEDPARLRERLGWPGLPRPAGVLLWLHAASVGEGLSLLPLIDQLRSARPRAIILVTTGTRTSAEVLEGRLPEGVIHQYAPLDAPTAVKRFITHWRPALGVFVESELWPNLILSARDAGARMALISARMSKASASNWRAAPGAVRTVLEAFDLILARDKAAADRLSSLGARVDGLADMKFGAGPLPADEARCLAVREALGPRKLILAASTHPGEDLLILKAFAGLGETSRRAVLVIVPRHPERGREVKAQAEALGLSAGRQGENQHVGDAAAHIADALGELGLWFRLADLVVIGGSLVAGVGGHNPLEPARLGVPFVSGPFVENWPVYDSLRALGATGTPVTVDDLQIWFRSAIEDADQFASMAQVARDWVAERDAESAAALTLISALAPS